METIYEELDEVKAENEKLRAECKSKAELCDSLKRAHNEQLCKIQEANSKLENQAQELNEKAEEVSEVKQLNEDLKRRLNEKESLVKHLSAVSDKLRVDSHDKYRGLEEQNRGLAMALDEANEKNIDQEQKINVFKAEIEGLKGLLSASQNKCMEAEKKAKASRDLRDRDDLMMKLEEQSRKVEDQLKWKKEQFKHLEEAHEKLQDRFKVSKKEWEQERSKLIDDICSLQTSLDSKTRISKDLQNRLQMCNQALAHEESRRKYLEVEVSEFRTRFENTFAEYEDTKSQLECLTDKRDKEIAALRHSLGTKETFYKEMEYRAGRLEEENQELLATVKELQEAQIQKAGSASSVAKLRNKLRSVEQMHKDCSANLRAKEAGWRSQMEKMVLELNDCKCELEHKNAALEELKMEIEGSHSSMLQLKMQNEELFVISLVLKASLSEAELKLANVGGEWNQHNEEREEHISCLMKQLEVKTAALGKAERYIGEEHEKTESLLRRIESLELIEEQGFVMKKEICRYKEMLEESSRCQSHIKERALQIENDYKAKLREACDALDMANIELAKERQKTKSLSIAVESIDHTEEKRLSMQKELEQRENDSKRKLEEVCDALDMANLELAKEREKMTSLLRAVESFDCIEEKRLLMQKELEQALQMDKDSKRKLKEVCNALEAANSELADKTSEGHQIEFELWIWKSITESLKADLEQSQELRKEVEASLLSQAEVGESLKQENRSFVSELEVKDRKLRNCEERVLLLEKELEKTEMQIEWFEREFFRQEFESALIVQIHAEQLFGHDKENLLRLVEEKCKKINDLQDVARTLEQKSSSLNSFSSHLAEKQAEINLVSEAREKISAAEIMAMVEREEKKLMIIELEEEICSLRQKLDMQEKSMRCSEQKRLEIKAEFAVKQSEMEKMRDHLVEKLRNLDALIFELKSEKQNLLEEKEGLLDFIGGLGNRISELNHEDMKLMDTLERMVTTGHSEQLDLEKENVNNYHCSHSPMTKKLTTLIEERSPFRLLN